MTQLLLFNHRLHGVQILFSLQFSDFILCEKMFFLVFFFVLSFCFVFFLLLRSFVFAFILLCPLLSSELERLQMAAWLKEEGGKLFKAAEYAGAAERLAFIPPYDVRVLRYTTLSLYLRTVLYEYSI